jgi:hypothetical protein
VLYLYVIVTGGALTRSGGEVSREAELGEPRGAKTKGAVRERGRNGSRAGERRRVEEGAPKAGATSRDTCL